MKHQGIYGVEDAITGHPVLPHDQWIAARKELLKKEKELTALSDEVNAARRALPWEKVEKDYTFEGPQGKLKLADLFGSKRQIILYHFMLAPGWEEGCVGCSHFADQVEGPQQHFEQADVNFLCVSRAPLAEIEKYRARMGWKFKWVSSNGSDFNYDYKVSFTPEQVAAGCKDYNYGTSPYPFDELPGISVFYKDEDGHVFHTYSAYARGLDVLIETHHFLDLTPKGRCETAPPPAQGWLRHHDKYESADDTSCCCGSGAKKETEAVA